MAYDYQTALDRIANTFRAYDQGRLAIAEQQMQRQQQLSDVEAQRTFSRQSQGREETFRLKMLREQEESSGRREERSGKRQLDYLKERDRLQLQHEKDRDEMWLKREEKRLALLSEEQIDKELRDAGANVGEATLAEKKRFLSNIRADLYQSAKTDLRSAFDAELANKRGLETAINDDIRSLGASQGSDEKQKRVALRMASDKKLKLTDDQRNRLELFATGKTAKSAKGIPIQPTSPNDLIFELEGDSRSRAIEALANELEATVTDPKKDAEILGIVSRLQGNQQQLKSLNDRIDMLLKQDPTLPRAALTQPLTGASRTRTGTPQGQTSRQLFAAAEEAPAGSATVTSTAPPPAQSQAITPLPAPAVTPQPLPEFIPSQPGVVSQFAAPAARAALMEAVPSAAAGPVLSGLRSIGETIGEKAGQIYGEQIAPRVDQLRSLIGPRIQEFTMRTFGVDNPNATPQEIEQVKDLVRRSRGYSDAEIERKQQLMRGGDIPTLREFFGYLKFVREQNKMRSVTPPVTQSATESTNVFMQPVQ